MSLVTLVAGKGSPGVTTSALVLAAVWPRPAVLAECDPAGGDLVFRLRRPDGQPLATDRGMVSLATAARATSVGVDVMSHVQVVDGGLPVLVGPASPMQTTAMAVGWPIAAHLLADVTDVDVVVDVGRLALDAPTAVLLRDSDRIVVACRATPAGVAHTRSALEQLRLETSVVAPVSVVVIGADDADRQVAAALRELGELDVLAPIADDPVAAAGLCGEWSRRLDRSRLVVSARIVARSIDERLSTSRRRRAPSVAPSPQPQQLVSTPAVGQVG